MNQMMNWFQLSLFLLISFSGLLLNEYEPIQLFGSTLLLMLHDLAAIDSFAKTAATISVLSTANPSSSSLQQHYLENTEFVDSFMPKRAFGTDSGGSKKKTAGGSLKGAKNNDGATLGKSTSSATAANHHRLILLHLPFQQHSKLHIRSGISAREAISAILKV